MFFGEAPKTAREGACAPRKSAIHLCSVLHARGSVLSSYSLRHDIFNRFHVFAAGVGVDGAGCGFFLAVW